MAAAIRWILAACTDASRRRRFGSTRSSTRRRCRTSSKGRYVQRRPAGSPPASHQPALLVVLGAYAECRPYRKAAGVRRASLSALLPSDAWTAQAGSRCGRPAHIAWQRSRNSVEAFSVSSGIPVPGSLAAVPLFARVRFFPRVIRFSGPPLGAHYGNSRQRRISEPLTISVGFNRFYLVLSDRVP